MHRRPVVLGGLAGLLAVLVLQALTGATDGRPLSGEDLYLKLTAAAAQGDAQAGEYVRALDEFMRAEGLQPDDLSLPKADRRTSAERGLLQLVVEDSAPWGVSVSNTTSLGNSAALNAYIAARSTALGVLSAEDPERQIEVVVAPSRASSIADLAAALECPCPTSTVVVDVFGPDGWLMSAGRDAGVRDLGAASKDLEAEIRDQVAVSLDSFPGVSTADLRVQVRSVRLSMTADAAVRAADQPGILLVDPLTDLADAYGGGAATVSVSNPPDVWETHARLVLEPIDGDAVQPVGK